MMIRTFVSSDVEDLADCAVLGQFGLGRQTRLEQPDVGVGEFFNRVEYAVILDHLRVVVDGSSSGQQD